MLDESTISDLIHDATRDLTVSAGLMDRVRSRGARRLRRRRIGTTVGVAALVAAIVPAAFALAPDSSRQAVTIGRGPSPRPSASSFPAARSCTGSGGGGAAPASTYPSLLMLPNNQRSVTYAFANTGGAPRCAYFPHVALTLLHNTGGLVSRGVVIEGPNAPSALQDGRAGPNTEFSGTTLHIQVDSHPATGYYIVRNAPAQIYWSGTDGDQWHASTRGLSPAEIDTVLNDVTYDPQAGTATLPNAAAQGWTVAPAAPDAAGDVSGVFYALWHVAGSRVALWVAPGPDRIDQGAATGQDPQLITVQGQPGLVGGRGRELVWQVSDDVTASLSMTHSSPAKIQQVADSIVSISPHDPRLYRP